VRGLGQKRRTVSTFRQIRFQCNIWESRSIHTGLASQGLVLRSFVYHLSRAQFHFKCLRPRNIPPHLEEGYGKWEAHTCQQVYRLTRIVQLRQFAAVCQRINSPIGQKDGENIASRQIFR